jgi:hypothetical protein
MACGKRHSDTEYMTALNAHQFDLFTTNGNNKSFNECTYTNISFAFLIRSLDLSSNVLNRQKKNHDIELL